MSVTAIGPGTESLPRVEAVPVLQTKAAWSDAWSTDNELVPVTADWSLASSGGSDMSLVRKYGPKVKDEDGTTWGARTPADHRGKWCRVRLAGAQGMQTVWIGRIESEKRRMEGSAQGPMGLQRWVAVSPVRILEKKRVYQSYWGSAATLVEVLPDVNLRGPDGILRGNRGPSLPPPVDSCVYGATDDPWNAYQYIDYLLKRFVQQYDEPFGALVGPAWSIAGQTDILQGHIPYAPLSASMWASDIIRAVMPPGMDYVCQPTAAGFALVFHSLAGQAETFDDATFPVNPNRVSISQGSDPDIIDCELEISDAQRYDRITVIGERVKVAFTLYTMPAIGWLVPGWSAAQEAAYKAGTGTPEDKPEEHDAARADDAFRDVFQTFVADDELDLTPFFGSYPTALDANRETLPHCLMKEGWDYTGASPAAPAGHDGHPDDLRPPLVIGYEPETGRPVPVDKIGEVSEAAGMMLKNMSVEALKHALGVRVKASPNHALAANHWTDGVAPAKSDFLPDYDGAVDWELLVVTLAAPADKRIRVSCAITGPAAAGDGSEMVIEVPGAEYWYLDAETVVGVAANGDFQWSPSEAVVLRDDSDDLALVAAGAKARYLAERVAARVTWRRLEDYSGIVGHILSFIGDGDDVQDVGAPISGVHYDFQKRTTTVMTGYAR